MMNGTLLDDRSVRGKMTPTSWSDLDLAGAEAWAQENKLPRYRGRQIFEALNKRGASDIRDVLELPETLRNRMSEDAPTRSVRARVHLTSATDSSQKALLELADGATVEAVLIPSGPAGKRRRTICVSSQVGCPAACTFCATGLQGFTRNLSATEILDQVLYFVPSLAACGDHVTNVVFMGMGEPFLNAPALREAIRRLTDPSGFGLGERRITVSTVGIVPQMRKFAEWGGQVNLAVSLHAPNDELRSRLVPYNQRFPIRDIVDAVEAYSKQTRRRVSFEYVLLRGVNDSPELAVELARLLAPLEGMAHVNVIPWNPFREGKFIRSEGPDAEAFVAVAANHGLNTTIRYSKGLDISAACGQLREREEKAGD